MDQRKHNLHPFEPFGWLSSHNRYLRDVESPLNFVFYFRIRPEINKYIDEASWGRQYKKGWVRSCCSFSPVRSLVSKQVPMVWNSQVGVHKFGGVIDEPGLHKVEFINVHFEWRGGISWINVSLNDAAITVDTSLQMVGDSPLSTSSHNPEFSRSHAEPSRQGSIFSYLFAQRCLQSWPIVGVWSVGRKVRESRVGVRVV